MNGSFILDADGYFTTFKSRSVIKCIQYKYGLLVPTQILWGTWLKYSTGGIYQMRFHKLTDARFEQYIHGQQGVILKRLGKLTRAYKHYFLAKGINGFLAPQIRY
jgi:hypothetical protein